MDRNRHATSYGSLPAPSSPGNPGYFHPGNPGLGIPATVLTADWANGITEEQVSIIEGAGLTLDVADNTQMMQAIGVLARRTNQVLNGQMMYWNAPRPIAEGTTGSVYGPDQWRVQAAGNTCSADIVGFAIGHSQVSGDPRQYLRVTSVVGSATGGDYVRLSQPIEDCTRFSGRQVTVAFDARSSSGTHNLGVSLAQNFGAGGSAEVPGIGGYKFTVTPSWQRFTRTVTLPSVSGKSIPAGIANTYLDLQLWLSAGADFDVLTGGAVGHQSWDLHVTNVRLVVGPTVPPIELRDERTEQITLRRYYEYGGTAFSAGGYFFSGGGIAVQAVGAGLLTVAAPVRYSAQKRVSPTLTILNPVNANNEMRNLTRNTDCSGTGLFRSAGLQAFIAQCTTAPGSAAGDVNGFHWIADARY